jgi:hypothetical protein
VLLRTIHLPSLLVSSAPLVFAEIATLWRAQNRTGHSAFNETCETEVCYSSGKSHNAALVKGVGCVTGRIGKVLFVGVLHFNSAAARYPSQACFAYGVSMSLPHHSKM